MQSKQFYIQIKLWSSIESFESLICIMCYFMIAVLLQFSIWDVEPTFEGDSGHFLDI